MERGNVINLERCRNYGCYVIFAADCSWCHWHSNMLLFFKLHYRYCLTFIISCKRINPAVLLLSLKYLIWHKIAERRVCKPVTAILESTVSELTAGKWSFNLLTDVLNVCMLMRNLEQIWCLCVHIKRINTLLQIGRAICYLPALCHPYISVPMLAALSRAREPHECYWLCSLHGEGGKNKGRAVRQDYMSMDLG